MKIIADETIPLNSDYFPKPFELQQVAQQDIKQYLKQAKILLCRSTLRVDQELLKDSSVEVVATATSGVDHIDEDYLAKHAIKLFDAKGANANAVADYVQSVIASLGKTINKIGIIGVGHVGQVLEKQLNELNYSLLLYDPPRAESQQFNSVEFEELFNCDLISLHAPLTFEGEYPTHHLIDRDFIKRMKLNSIIINSARGGIVDEQALLDTKRVIYCSDVFENEPNINHQIIDYCNIATPHIAGHSIEAKQLAPVLLSNKIHRYYGLNCAFSDALNQSACSLAKIKHWQKKVLSFYDPRLESRALKQADSDEKAQELFLSLRKKHRTRHDFSYYLT